MKKIYQLTHQQVAKFLSRHNLMAVATYGDHPWVANVYYSFDPDLTLYFLSDPATLHCRQIEANPQVAVSIFDSHQSINQPKRGLQLWGEASQISGQTKIMHVVKLWKSSLKVSDATITYENMIKKVITGRMYQIIPKQIKLFDQKLFPVEDGQEPVLNL